MISSLANPLIKDVAALQKKASLRRQEGLFVVEGRRFAEEAPKDRLETVFVTEEFAESPEGRAFCAERKTETVTQAVMKKMSDTQTPQGVLALVRMKESRFEELLGGPVLALEQVQDPGNLGTLFRSAEAAGAGGLIMDRGTADPYSPKVLRATMGAIFRLPFLVTEDLPSALSELRLRGYRILAAHLKGKDLYESPLPEKMIFLLGNEGNGLSCALTKKADALVRIPMEGKTESLNVAVAGSLLLYEARRRRHMSAQP